MVLLTLSSDIYAKEFKLGSKQQDVDTISGLGYAQSTDCQSLRGINVRCASSLSLDILYCPSLETGYGMNIPTLSIMQTLLCCVGKIHLELECCHGKTDLNPAA